MQTFVVDNQILSALVQVFQLLLFGVSVFFLVSVIMEVTRQGWSKKMAGDIMAGLILSLLFGFGIITNFFTFSRIDVTSSNSWVLKNDFNIVIGTIDPLIEKPEISISPGFRRGFRLKIKTSTSNFEAFSRKKEYLEYIKQNLTF